MGKGSHENVFLLFVWIQKNLYLSFFKSVTTIKFNGCVKMCSLLYVMSNFKWELLYNSVKMSHKYTEKKNKYAAIDFYQQLFGNFLGEIEWGC